MLAYLFFNLIIFGALLSFYVVFIASFFVDNIDLSDYMGIDKSRFAWVILIMLLPATCQYKLFIVAFFFIRKNASFCNQKQFDAVSIHYKFHFF